jgi:phosphohistidine swiveling domain-containing protein
MPHQRTNHAPAKGCTVQERWITDWPVSERWTHYTRANAGEVLPNPASPLGQQFSWEKGMIPGWRDAYIESGNYSLDEFDADRAEVVGFFGGYLFINLSNVRMQGVRSPAITIEQLDLAFFGDRLDVPAYIAHPDDDRPDLMEKALRHIGWMLTAQDYPEIDAFKQQTITLRCGRPDLSMLTDDELVARARMTQPLLQTGFHHHGVASSASGVAPGILYAIGDAIDDPTMPMVLCSGIGNVDSAEPSYRMWELSRQVRASRILTTVFNAGVDGLLDRLKSEASADAAEFLAAWDQFIIDFGSRGPSEWEMASPTWETEPELALAALNQTRWQTDVESPANRNQTKVIERTTKIAEVRAAVAALGNDGLNAQLEVAIVATNQLAFRERTKTNLVRVVHEGRMVFRELGRRHGLAGNLNHVEHVFMLLDDEVESFVKNPTFMTTTLAGRYEQWHELWDLEPPFIITDGNVPPLPQWPRKGQAIVESVATGDILQGIPGCPGVVQGIARVILDPRDPMALEPGDIMIAPVLDPAWTPLFMTAGGVIVNVGGQISHAIIVSRELGLPCVVSVEHATDQIPNGATIEVNGATGKITIIELP